MQDFRRSLPEQSRLIVCKNTLLKQAVDKAGSGFSELSQAAKVRAAATSPNPFIASCMLVVTSISF